MKEFRNLLINIKIWIKKNLLGLNNKDFYISSKPTTEEPEDNGK